MCTNEINTVSTEKDIGATKSSGRSERRGIATRKRNQLMGMIKINIAYHEKK